MLRTGRDPRSKALERLGTHTRLTPLALAAAPSLASDLGDLLHDAGQHANSIAQNATVGGWMLVSTTVVSTRIFAGLYGRFPAWVVFDLGPDALERGKAAFAFRRKRARHRIDQLFQNVPRNDAVIRPPIRPPKSARSSRHVRATFFAIGTQVSLPGTA
jgi:hypothetical protein